MKDCGYARIEDLATEVGISRQHMQSLLAGTYLPGIETAHNLATALRCLVDDLTEPGGAA